MAFSSTLSPKYSTGELHAEQNVNRIKFQKYPLLNALHKPLAEQQKLRSRFVAINGVSLIRYQQNQMVRPIILQKRCRNAVQDKTVCYTLQALPFIPCDTPRTRNAMPSYGGRRACSPSRPAAGLTPPSPEQNSGLQIGLPSPVLVAALLTFTGIRARQ
jgi:hypothetical protein